MWVTGAMVVVAAVVCGEVAGALDGGRHHTINRLDSMLNKVEASIKEKEHRLSGGHVYPSNERAWDEDEISIVESPIEAEEETHPEGMEDYVNIAPWTRRTGHTQPVNIIDMRMIELAAANAQRVKTEGKCEVPQQRCEVIRSSQHPPDTVFLPRCALLHRCSEDAGCCLNKDNVCAPAETETVELFFYAFGDLRAKIEAMTFVNHTRCSCQSRKVTPTCKCPRYYSPKLVDGQCICDCDLGRSKCRRYKKGRRYFSSTDVRCIITNECSQPTCDYGPFLARQRRCTKRRERERYVVNRK